MPLNTVHVRGLGGAHHRICLVNATALSDTGQTLHAARCQNPFARHSKSDRETGGSGTYNETARYRVSG